MTPHANRALAETGTAVLVSQNLERLLFELFEFRKLHRNFNYAKGTNGELKPGHYKYPLINGVNLLRDQGAIHPTLDSALLKYIEDRHVLVHRWALEHGYPDYNNFSAWNALAEHARSVTTQATTLFGFFTTYLVEHAMPNNAAQNYPAYQERMLNMFNREFR